ncbi:MAG TPA: hypothetical protein VIM11_05100 [Tepidisphaeraceae bacterium]
MRLRSARMDGLSNTANTAAESGVNPWLGSSSTVGRFESCCRARACSSFGAGTVNAFSTAEGVNGSG